MIKQNKDKTYTLQLAHGWFGGALKKDIAPTINSRVKNWHVLLVEILDNEHISNSKKNKP